MKKAMRTALTGGVGVVLALGLMSPAAAAQDVEKIPL